MTTHPANPDTFDPEEWISKSDASRARGVSRQAIWELVNRGRLTTIRHAGRLYVSRSEVMNFKRRQRGPAGSGYVRGKTIKRKKRKPPDPSKWIGTVEAARMARVTRQVIADLIRRRTLRRLVVENKTYVQIAGVEQFIQQQSRLKG